MPVPSQAWALSSTKLQSRLSLLVRELMMRMRAVDDNVEVEDSTKHLSKRIKRFGIVSCCLSQQRCWLSTWSVYPSASWSASVTSYTGEFTSVTSHAI